MESFTPDPSAFKADSGADEDGRLPDGRFGPGNKYRAQSGHVPVSPGRPPGKTITATLKKMLEDGDGCKAVAQALVELALAGNRGSVEATRLIMDRVEGPVSRRLELDGTVHHKTVILDGGPRAAEALDAHVLEEAAEEEEVGE